VKASELKRWLKRQGCAFFEESRHTRIVLGSRISRMPRHPAKDIKAGTLRAILRDLGLTM
jgi:mRNA interferase HicA